MFLDHTQRRSTVGRSECRVLSGRGLCDELITRPEEYYRLCCVVVCDLETSRMGAPYIYIYIYGISCLKVNNLTLILLTWRKWWAPNNASKYQMGFNSGFKGLNEGGVHNQELNDIFLATSSRLVYQINIGCHFTNDARPRILYIHLFTTTCFGQLLRLPSCSFKITLKEVYWGRGFSFTKNDDKFLYTSYCSK